MSIFDYILAIFVGILLFVTTWAIGRHVGYDDGFYNGFYASFKAENKYRKECL